MKYRPDLDDAISLVGDFSAPRYIKPGELWPDMLLGAVVLVLFIAFFVYLFGARLRRASKGSIKGKRP